MCDICMKMTFLFPSVSDTSERLVGKLLITTRAIPRTSVNTQNTFDVNMIFLSSTARNGTLRTNTRDNSVASVPISTISSIAPRTQVGPDTRVSKTSVTPRSSMENTIFFLDIMARLINHTFPTDDFFLFSPSSMPYVFYRTHVFLFSPRSYHYHLSPLGQRYGQHPYRYSYVSGARYR